MIVKCKNCSMNENCICIPSADECYIRKEAYNKAIDDLLTHCKGSRNGEGDCFTCVFSCWKDDEWECCYLEKLKQ